MIKENANRKTISAGVIFNQGNSYFKKHNQQFFSAQEKNAFDNNILYLHDAEYFTLSLNCLSLSLKTVFEKPIKCHGVSLPTPTTLAEIITQLMIMMVNIENEVSGGLAWVNFDQELADFCHEKQIQLNRDELFHWLQHWFQFINFANSRVDQSPYISYSIGVINSEKGAMVCDVLLEVLGQGAAGNKPYIFPNVQFRVCEKINANEQAPYFAQYRHALAVTAKQMNPTYLLADSAMNHDIAPEDLHVVGCRSRLLTTTEGIKKTGCNRTNIGVVSLNLPHLAMQAMNEEALYPLLETNMSLAMDVLLKKSDLLADCLTNHAPTLIDNNLLFPNNNSVEAVLEQASMSIGFIGGAELCQLMLPEGTSSEKDQLLKRVLDFMHGFCTEQSAAKARIFTLIGVSGEGLSYKFLQGDSNLLNNNLDTVLQQHQTQGFYTNSFHIPVDEHLSITEKLAREGLFHTNCHGGGISYVELSHLQSNTQGLDDILKLASQYNCNYLGFNFDKNVCNQCNQSIDCHIECPCCGSKDITQIRRVSGYLGYLSQFSHGKALEQKLRVKHTQIETME